MSENVESQDSIPAPEKGSPLEDQAEPPAENDKSASNLVRNPELRRETLTFSEVITSVDLINEYENACTTAGRKINALVKRSISDSIAANKKTFHIDAPGNHKLSFTSRIGDDDIGVLAKILEPATNTLARFDISYNHITDVGCRQLATTLLAPSATDRLSSVSFRSNSIGPEGCFDLCQALVVCQSLRRLDFSHNPLGRDGGLIVVDMLRHSPGLLELYLHDTESDIDVMVALAEALLNPALNLKVLNVENARIETLQEGHTVHFGRMLRVNTHLQEMYMGKLKMRDEGIRQLVSFLLENKTLRVLSLRCNELGADGAEHLGVYLASDCQLSSLDLSCNRIGERCNVGGAKALAEALVRNRMLRHLDLNGNMLCGEALKAIADSVDQNAMLDAIALFHNNWDQPASYKFHQILNDRARVLPLKADFVTSEVDLRIDICKVEHFGEGPREIPPPWTK